LVRRGYVWLFINSWGWGKNYCMFGIDDLVDTRAVLNTAGEGSYSLKN
jgi:hypothetical protein